MGSLKLGARQLRHTKPKGNEIHSVARSPIYLVLDNIIDTYNIGSLFRLGDAIGVEKIYICGDTEYPPSSKIHKAAVGTEEWVPWEKVDSTQKTVENLKSEGVQIIAVEQNKDSIPYQNLTKELLHFPIAIVVGNETTGVSKEVLGMSDIVVELPMLGINKSFNVWGSAAVIAYKILESIV